MGHELALTRDERLANSRLTGDERGRNVHLRRTNCRGDVMAVDPDASVADVEFGALRERRNCRFIREIDSMVQGVPRERAVHRARVHMAVAKPLCDGAGNRALAGA